MDTDYENYLITYQCHQEFRRARTSDDLSLYWENWRLSVEEGRTRTAEEMATFVKEKMNNDKRFQHLQALLVEELAKEKKTGEPATDKVLQEELDSFLKLKINHDHVFRGYKPSIDLWRDMRPHYGVFLGDEAEEQADAAKMQWFNRPIITLYMRNVSEASPLDLREYSDLFLDSVPGNNFVNTHMQVDHLDAEMCPQDIADIFSHPNATSYLALLNPSPSKFKEAEAAAKQFEEELEREEKRGHRPTAGITDESYDETDRDEDSEGPGDADSRANHDYDGEDEQEDHDNEDKDEMPDYENIEDLNDDDETEEYDENATAEEI